MHRFQCVAPYACYPSQSGLSLIELLTGLAIFGLLIGLGVPSYRDWIASRQLANHAEYLAETLNLTRSEAVKRGLKGIARSGANNPMFGRAMSEETKQKIRDAIDERGGISGSNNPNYRGKT